MLSIYTMKFLDVRFLVTPCVTYMFVALLWLCLVLYV